MIRRRSSIKQIVACGSLAAVLPLVVGCCCGLNKSRSILTSQVAGRKISASLDGNAGISSQGDAAVVNFSGGTLTVKSATVELNGKELAMLPEGAENIDIDFTAGKLTITADGERILDKQIRE